jgi:transposase
LLERGETVVRLPPRLMADLRRGARERGKSDPIDALAIARAALREGVDTLLTARLAGPELEIRLLGLHRERLVDSRTRLINELRWQLHDLWPEWELPLKALIHPSWQTKITRRLQGADPSVRVRIARDVIRRIRELTRTIGALQDELACAGRPNRPAAARRDRDRGPAGGQVHRRDRRDRPLQLRRATRADGRLRSDPRLLRPH